MSIVDRDDPCGAPEIVFLSTATTQARPAAAQPKANAMVSCPTPAEVPMEPVSTTTTATTTATTTPVGIANHRAATCLGPSVVRPQRLCDASAVDAVSVPGSSSTAVPFVRCQVCLTLADRVACQASLTQGRVSRSISPAHGVELGVELDPGRMCETVRRSEERRDRTQVPDLVVRQTCSSSGVDVVVG